MKQSRVYLEGALIKFQNNEAKFDLQVGTEYELYWRLFGTGGATLTIEITHNGNQRKIVDSSKIPSNRTRKSDFTFFKI